jgi:electron transport complex protein RnfG
MSTKEASSFRLVATLALTGLLSGLVLVGVFLVTQPIILRNQAEAMQRAIFRVLPGTTAIDTFVLSGQTLQPYESADGSMPTADAVFAGRTEDGSLVGYAIPADGAGFMDTIKLIYGFDPTRRAIVGMQVLDSRETPGLGDKIIFDEEFHRNFVELKVEPEIVGVKVAEKPRPSNEVDTITGATISSEAVVSILNDSTQRWLPILDRQQQGAGQAANEGTGDDTPEGS